MRSTEKLVYCIFFINKLISLGRFSFALLIHDERKLTSLIFSFCFVTLSAAIPLDRVGTEMWRLQNLETLLQSLYY